MNRSVSLPDRLTDRTARVGVIAGSHEQVFKIDASAPDTAARDRQKVPNEKAVA